MREGGWYWVLADGEWYIALFSDWTGKWSFSGETARFYDNYFEEIDERRIVREVE